MLARVPNEHAPATADPFGRDLLHDRRSHLEDQRVAGPDSGWLLAVPARVRRGRDDGETVVAAIKVDAVRWDGVAAAGRRIVVRVTTVLVVEDDPAISGPLSRALQREGYAVLAVASGAAAVGHCADPGAEVALVILDLGLPEMDGLEVCRRVRARGPECGADAHRPHGRGRFVVGLDAGADD